MSHSQFITPCKALSHSETNSITGGKSVEIPCWVMQVNLTQRNKEGVGIVIKITQREHEVVRRYLM